MSAMHYLSITLSGATKVFASVPVQSGKLMQSYFLNAHWLSWRFITGKYSGFVFTFLDSVFIFISVIVTGVRDSGAI